MVRLTTFFLPEKNVVVLKRFSRYLFIDQEPSEEKIISPWKVYAIALNSKRLGRVYGSSNIIACRYNFVTSAIILSSPINQQCNGKNWGRCLPILTLEILSVTHFNILAPVATRISVHQVIKDYHFLPQMWLTTILQMEIIFIIDRPAILLEGTSFSAKGNCYLQSGVWYIGLTTFLRLHKY